MKTDVRAEIPKTGEVLREVDARQLWQRILETRLQTGEPYILNIDPVNRALPKHQRELGLKVNTSNLCSEITLPTGMDHDGKERTAVCCLSSLNFETWDQWGDDEGLVEDVLRMLDNVLTSFIETAPDSMNRAKYSALRERSVGLGVMGFHSFLQAKGIPMESAMAKCWNLRIFRKIRREADAASYILAVERGACPDAEEKGMKARFSHKLAIAPTASISIICGGTSACVEPIPANVYTHKTLSGAFSVRNPYLEALLEGKGADTDATWQSIVEQEGSVQHLDCLTRRREGGLSHRLRDRPALGDRTGSRPHAVYLPEPVAEPVPACRYRQMGPAHAALDGVGARHQEPVLLPLQIHQPRRLCRAAREEGRESRRRAEDRL